MIQRSERARGNRVRVLTTSLAVLAVLALTAAGCSAAEDVASSAGDAASQAARDAAVAELREQVCPLVQDRQLSEDDRQTLQAAVDLAQAAGAESEFLTTVEDVAGADGTPPESQVAQLAEDCEAA